MAPRRNPLKLNGLQARTLAILQQMAKVEAHARTAGDDGSVVIGNFPAPHDDHYHIGDAVVLRRDSSGLHNPAVFAALQRKGLVAVAFDGGAKLTREGLAYDTGVAESVLHRGHE